MQDVTITEYHESQNGTCDVCGRKAKSAVAIKLPSMAYDYACQKCVFTLIRGVAKADKKPSQAAMPKVS